MVLGELFTLFIYQPFFNILVFFYWMLSVLTNGHPDMGIAVILLTLLIRFLLLPLSLAGHDSEGDRRKLAEGLKELEETYGDDQDAFRLARKKIMRKNQPIVLGEVTSLIIQIMIALMLWRIFATGLEGEDIHLLYSFMPEVTLPFNLTFLGWIDLSHTSFFLNFIQSSLIFIFETLSMMTSPFPYTRAEVVRYQLTLPIVSFLIFMGLPAGKKLFVITTLCFSIVLTLIKYTHRRFLSYKQKVADQADQPAIPAEEQPLVVEVQ